MPTYEVRRPDAVGKYWIVEIEVMDAVISEKSLRHSYSTKVAAQADADRFNAAPYLAIDMKLA